MVQILTLATSLALALLATRFFKKLGFNFPDVTVFLVTGLLLGPYVIGRLNISGLGFNSIANTNEYGFISTVALGFIAFSIGNEFKLSQLKGIGRSATIIGIFQSVTAMLVVDVVLILVAVCTGFKIINIPTAITLGAIATATAPAATLMVVKQYKARGELTGLLLPIVALDDAVGLVAFAVSFGMAEVMISGQISIVSILVNPIIEIIASLMLGSIMGYILTKLEELFYSNSNRLSLTIAFVLLTVAISGYSFNIGPVTVKFSSLLVCMMLGTVLCNLCPRSGDIMKRADGWTVPLNTLFFVISGAELELGVFKNGWFVVIGIIYIITRSMGKYYGARLSADFTHCSEKVRKYLGYTLFPQAGVALGMCQQAVKLGSTEGKIIKNIILFAILIYELAGPSITHWALVKSGDIVETPENKKDHSRFTTPKDYKHAK